MLARRFTIVCLITMLFAMGFSRIVARSSDGPAEWRSNMPASCAVHGSACQAAAGKLAWVR